MSLWSDFFGNGDTVKKGMDLVDEAFLTDQEKGELKVELMKAYHPFKKAQRLFMLITTVPYMLVWSVCAVMAIYHGGYKAGLNLLEGDIGMIVLVVAAFYFGGGAVDSLRRK